MANIGGYNEQYRQQAQMMNMRGAQMVEQQTGRKASDGTTIRAKGSRKQRIGTVLGIAAVFAVLILLVALDIL